MILFTILALMAIILLLITITVLSAFGAGFLIIFGDVIVCIFLLVILCKAIINRKKR